jgi:UrcA family protein
MFRIIQIAALAIIASCFAAPAALAKPVERSETVRISYADLDLSKPAGVEVLMRRVSQAVDKICGSRPRLSQIAANVRFEVCRDDTTKRAITSIDNPMLTVMFYETRPLTKLASRR